MKETGLKSLSNIKDASPTAFRSPTAKPANRNLSGGFSKLVIPPITEPFQDKLAQTISAQLKSASRAKLDDYDLASPTTSSNRLRTLKIFKQKFSTEKKEGFDLYPPKKVNNDPIRIGDSENTVKYLVSKKKREYETKKKHVIKGTMYVNDLWATDFERDIIKSARIDKELSQAARAQRRSKPGSPVDRKGEVLKPVTVQSIDDASGDEVGSTDIFRKSFGEKHFLLGDDHQRLYTDRSDEPSSAGIRRLHFTEESVQEYTPFTKKFSQPSLPLWKIEDSGMNTGAGFIRNYYPGDGSQSARHLTTKKGGYMNTDRHMVTFSNEASPITERMMSSRGRRDMFVEQKSKHSDMKMFLGAASQQFNILLDDCETELRDKTDFMTRINDLKGLFSNPKFDKKVRRQLMERKQTVGDFRYMLDKKTSKVMKRQATIAKFQNKNS